MVAKTIFANYGTAFKLDTQRKVSRGTPESKEKGGTTATAPDPPGKKSGAATATAPDPPGNLDSTCALERWWVSQGDSILDYISGYICVGNRMGSDGKKRKVFKQFAFSTKHVNVALF